MKKLTKKESLYFLLKGIEQYDFFLQQNGNIEKVKSYFESEDLKALYDSKNTDGKGITHETNRHGKIENIVNSIEWAIIHTTQWNKDFHNEEYLEILSAYNADSANLLNRDKAERNHCVVAINDIVRIATGCDKIIVGRVCDHSVTIGLKNKDVEPRFDGSDELNRHNQIELSHYTEKDMFDLFSVSENTHIRFSPYVSHNGKSVDELADYVCFTKHICDVVGDSKVMQGIYDVWSHYIATKKDLVERMQARKNQFVQDKIKVFAKLITDYVAEHYGFTPELDI